jgi:hypothetical protein
MSERDDPMRYLMSPSEEWNAAAYAASQDSHASHNMAGGSLGLTGVQLRSSLDATLRRDPFSDYHRYNIPTIGDSRLIGPSNEAIGIAFTKDFDHPPDSREKPRPLRVINDLPDAARNSTPSPAPSTPSVYPPSLPPFPEKDEDYAFYTRQTQRRSDPENDPLPIPPKALIITKKNGSNPFISDLDPKGKNIYANLQVPGEGMGRTRTIEPYQPLTPPDSSPGNSPVSPTFTGNPDELTKTQSQNPFSKTFLGRSVSAKSQAPIPRPVRSPLRPAFSVSQLHSDRRMD